MSDVILLPKNYNCMFIEKVWPGCWGALYFCCVLRA